MFEIDHARCLDWWLRFCIVDPKPVNDGRIHNEHLEVLV